MTTNFIKIVKFDFKSPSGQLGWVSIFVRGE